MPRRSRKRKTKYVTKRALPFLLMKQAEAKFRQVEDEDSVSDVLPIQLNLTEIATGVTRNDRIGNAIQCTGVYFECTFAPNLDPTFGTDNARYARVVLYTKRNTTTSDLDVRPMQFADFDKYIIWSDKVVPVGWTNQIANGKITIKKKFKPYMKVMYDGGGSGSCENNPLHIMISTDQPNPNLIDCNYKWRLYFRDL